MPLSLHLATGRRRESKIDESDLTEFWVNAVARPHEIQHRSDGDDGRSLRPNQVGDPRDVVGVRMGDQDREERLAQGLALPTEGLALGLGESRVDGDHPISGLDQEGVGEDAAFSAGMGVDGETGAQLVSRRHGAGSVLTDLERRHDRIADSLARIPGEPGAVYREAPGG